MYDTYDILLGLRSILTFHFVGSVSLLGERGELEKYGYGTGHAYAVGGTSSGIRR